MDGAGAMDPPSFATTFEFAGYSVRFSPFQDRIAVATAQHFGIVGNGRVFVFDVTPEGFLVEVRTFSTMDGLYDVCWSEENENQFVTCSGDGTIKLWDMGVPSERPLLTYSAHKQEVYSVSWDLQTKEHFLSGSWDSTVCLWDASRDVPLNTFAEHTYCVYEANWSPTLPRTFGSASGDCTLKLWDSAVPNGAVQTIHAHDFEVLSFDWNKYDDNQLVTASVDKSLRLWDLRRPDQFVSALHGHTYAVRRVRFSPHCANMLLSASYDMSVIVWDMLAPQDPLLNTRTHHTEFAVGIDWSLFSDYAVSCGWDGQVALWHEPARLPA